MSKKGDGRRQYGGGNEDGVFHKQRITQAPPNCFWNVLIEDVLENILEILGVFLYVSHRGFRRSEITMANTS